MSSYAFKLGSTTDLTVYPNVRFSPQTIEPDTADKLLVSTVDVGGVINLPPLDSSNGESFAGKTVEITNLTGGHTLTVRRVDANGDPVDQVDLQSDQDWVQVTAYWDAALSQGGWLISAIGKLKDVRNAADTGTTSAFGPGGFA